MKDIGSLMPLYDEDLVESQSCPQHELQEDLALFSLCREALYAVGEWLGVSEKKVLLPAYTCDTVIIPFVELGWTCLYYPVDLQLRIDTRAVEKMYEKHKPSLIVVHPYYGKDLNESEINMLERLHGLGCKVVLDKTQCIFSTQRLSCVNYYVGSYRKWFAIPDGGYLWSVESSRDCYSVKEEYDDFVSLQRDAMYLRGRYYRTSDEELKAISIRMNKMAEKMIDYHITPHGMSAFSQDLLRRSDWHQCQEKRMSNYRVLLNGLSGVKECKILCEDMNEVSSAPLYFSIYVDDRSELQRALAKEHIYLPVIWPLGVEDVLINDTIKYIYSHILSIPIDQRYDEADMEKIVRGIKHHYNG